MPVPDIWTENWSLCACTCNSSSCDHVTGYIHYFTVTFIVTDIAINGSNEEFRFLKKWINHTLSKNKSSSFWDVVKRMEGTISCTWLFIFLFSEYKTDFMLLLENWTYTTKRVSKYIYFFLIATAFIINVFESDSIVI